MSNLPLRSKAPEQRLLCLDFETRVAEVRSAVARFRSHVLDVRSAEISPQKMRALRHVLLCMLKRLDCQLLICNPSHETIAADAELSARYVRELLELARGLGLVSWKHCQSKRDGQRFNAYRFSFELVGFVQPVYRSSRVKVARRRIWDGPRNADGTFARAAEPETPIGAASVVEAEPDAARAAAVPVVAVEPSAFELSLARLALGVRLDQVKRSAPFGADGERLE